MQTVLDVRDGALYEIWLAQADGEGEGQGQGQGKEDKSKYFRALSDVVEISAEAAVSMLTVRVREKCGPPCGAGTLSSARSGYTGQAPVFAFTLRGLATVGIHITSGETIGPISRWERIGRHQSMTEGRDV